jgi:acetyl esterase/lipase
MILDQARAFAGKARAAGVEATLEVYPGMTHVWHGLAGAIPTLQAATDAIGQFVRGHVNHEPRAIDGAGGGPG